MSDVQQVLPSIETSRIILLEHSAPGENVMLLPLFDDNTFGTATQPPFPDLTEVVGCANGLVCISYPETKFALWNPALQKVKMICVEKPSRRGKKGVWPHSFYGFGYDSTHDDYKFVQMVVFYVSGDEEGSKIKDPTDHGKQSANKDSPTKGKEGPRIKRICVRPPLRMPVFESSEVNVYSVKSNSWKKIESLPCNGHGLTSKPICLNNCICCVMDGIGHRCSILCLDLGSEEYRMFPIPDGVPRPKCLGVVGGCLCVSCYMLGGRYVWIMKQFGVAESWTLLSSHPNHPPFKVTYMWPIKPLVFSNDGRMVLLNKEGQLVWFDLDKKSEKLAEIPGETDCCFGIKATLCEGLGTRFLHDGDPVSVVSVGDGDSSSSSSSSSECLYPHNGDPESDESLGGSSCECSSSIDTSNSSDSE